MFTRTRHEKRKMVSHDKLAYMLTPWKYELALKCQKTDSGKRDIDPGGFYTRTKYCSITHLLSTLWYEFYFVYFNRAK